MNSFEQDKADKLRRLPGLRVMQMLGMITWREDKYGGAQQVLRLLNPLVWVWVCVQVVVASVLHGVPEVWAELKSTLRNDSVWW